jgi:hypothetical protein
MGYRNKTYVIFDGENDMWAYRYMRGWKQSKHIDFDFHDAHDLNDIREWSMPETIKRRLRERFLTAKQIIVLIGPNTKHKHRFVRWEMEVALNLDLPIIAVNLNHDREMDLELCPAILRNEPVVHVAFRAKIIKHALENFPRYYRQEGKYKRGPFYYDDSVYSSLGL